MMSKIGTFFPGSNTLVTLPGIHATQREAYLRFLNQQRQEHGLPPITKQEEACEWYSAVDLILEDNAILIRPDPDNMRLAFEADELLQRLVPKHKIKFLGVLDEKIRKAIEKQGEWWRITPLPKSPEEMKEMIKTSRIGIRGSELYYYSQITGTRFLTCWQFADLKDLDDAALRAHLIEIQEHSARINAHGFPELAFFATDSSFSKSTFTGRDFRSLEAGQLRTVYQTLQAAFTAAVKSELRQDDPENVEWRNSMVAALVGQGDETVSEETLLGLSPEFYMQIEWLPGGRIEDGELIFDCIVEEAGLEGDGELKRLCDDKPRKYIFNFVREYGDLEYVNIGRVIGSLSRRPAYSGRRGVYIAVFKLYGSDREVISVLRMQKHGVREYLEEGCSLLDAMIRSEEYTEYVLDRRLGCRQLGMNVPMRTMANKISEWYVPRNGEGFVIWSPYFERDYIRGMATDKLLRQRFENEEFASRFARLLGRAAAPNLIVGRCDLGGKVVFDDGDEVLILDPHEMPVDLVVTDHTGAFSDYQRELTELAPEYANPVLRRLEYLPDPQRFADTYLEGFLERFSRIQSEFRKRRKAFNTLFKHRPRGDTRSFSLRWEEVLARFDRADARILVKLIRETIAAN